MRRFSGNQWWKPVLSGVLIGLSRLPLHLHFLAFIGLIPLISCLDAKKRGNRFLLALLYAVPLVAVTLYWLRGTAAFSTMAGPPFLTFLIGLMFILLIGFLFAVIYWLVFLLYDLTAKHLPQFRVVALVGLWTGSDWIMNFGELRFPWMGLGYALTEYPVLLQVAGIGGVYLLSAGIWAVNLLIRDLIHRRKAAVILLPVTLTLWIGLGSWMLSHQSRMSASGLRVGIVQPNIAQEVKHDWDQIPRIQSILDKHTKALKEQGAGLVIWPEGVVPYPVHQRNGSAPWRTSAINDIPIVLGFPEIIPDPAQSPQDWAAANAAVQLNPDRSPEKVYRKIALVPFGERMPGLSLFPFLWDVHLGQANFLYGDSLRLYPSQEYRYSPLICFEMAFSTLSRQAVENGADFLVNLTNDGWFGETWGPWQHAQMARMRAVETRRMIFRSANTGISMIIAPDGSVPAQLGLMREGHLIGQAIRVPGNTIFVAYGYMFAPFLFVIGLGLALTAGFLTALSRWKYSEMKTLQNPDGRTQ